ncbi:unnamed protein product [Danaus chrysippus]|uniref:(African queen) hypothetical protein n=1 Tax=Danaus chrysippus TaxID=151541 RepID=A0A8J2Q1A8_9NEOP|nr:unnamed protein product [Danaus chrysippus]
MLIVLNIGLSSDRGGVGKWYVGGGGLRQARTSSAHTYRRIEHNAAAFCVDVGTTPVRQRTSSLNTHKYIQHGNHWHTTTDRRRGRLRSDLLETGDWSVSRPSLPSTPLPRPPPFHQSPPPSPQPPPFPPFSARHYAIALYYALPFAVRSSSSLVAPSIV